ncbi:MAG TPA: histidine phosphatase family protein [Pseudolabrys sp.]|nr:histidine phosphatase family protein [Pseudolabrys sp.]
MATTFFLVRHATHGLIERVLMGRTDESILTGEGRAQADRLGRFFAGRQVEEVQSSPRSRARDTAAPIATHLGRPIVIEPALNELDYGEWSGRSFESLCDDPHWHSWNRARGSTRVPGGETMAELQARTMAHLRHLHRQDSRGAFVLVSHAEVIRAALLHALGWPLDDFAKLDLAPASVSTVRAEDGRFAVAAINEQATA